MNREAAAWNFSAVRLWPLVLLVGPLVLAALWYGLTAAERRELYEAALSDGARVRGVLLALAAIAVCWVGAWRHSALMEEIVARQGDAVLWRPSVWMRLGWMVPNYLSLIVWSGAFVYAYAGRAGVRRVWLPAAVFVALMILSYGGESTSWVALWDSHAQWGYGYFIGPIAAMIFYFLLLERTGLTGGASSPEPRDGVLLTPATTQSVEASSGFPPRRLLMAWGVVGVVLGLAAVALDGNPRWVDGLLGSATEVVEPVKMVLMFWYVPLAAGGAALALSVWLGVSRSDRGDLAVRLAGLAVLVASVAWRWHAGTLRVRYFADLTFVPVALGAALAVGGWRLGRVVWAPVLFLLLAVPWPERYYVALAARPQLYAAMMAERFMELCGYDIWREGNKLIMDAATQEGLTVAEECSGLKIMLAFVALSVVYAYLTPRPAWRRAVIFLSSVPIAVFCNFTRVALMALVYRWGFKEIAHGMTHELGGFAMLPLAFVLLWAEMRVLDGIERIADWVATDPRRSGGDEASGRKESP
jgi:exosortase